MEFQEAKYAGMYAFWAYDVCDINTCSVNPKAVQGVCSNPANHPPPPPPPRDKIIPFT